MTTPACETPANSPGVILFNSRLIQTLRQPMKELPLSDDGQILAAWWLTNSKLGGAGAERREPRHSGRYYLAPRAL